MYETRPPVFSPGILHRAVHQEAMHTRTSENGDDHADVTVSATAASACSSVPSDVGGNVRRVNMDVVISALEPVLTCSASPSARSPADPLGPTPSPRSPPPLRHNSFFPQEVCVTADLVVSRHRVTHTIPAFCTASSGPLHRRGVDVSVVDEASQEDETPTTAP